MHPSHKREAPCVSTIASLMLPVLFLEYSHLDYCATGQSKQREPTYENSYPL